MMGAKSPGSVKNRDCKIDTWAERSCRVTGSGHERWLVASLGLADSGARWLGMAARSVSPANSEFTRRSESRRCKTLPRFWIAI